MSLRAALVFLAAASTLTVGAVRLIQIEVERGPHLRERAKWQERRAVPLPAERGAILDARGRVLAASVPTPSVFVDSTMISNFAFEAAAVAEVLGLDARELEAELLAKRARQFVWVKRFVTAEEAAGVKQLRADRLTRAFVVQNEPKRHYPLGRVACHVVGFVGAEQHGFAGIEQRFDDLLTGTPGQRVATVDVLGRRVDTQPDEYDPPRHGSTVVLTIDTNIQQRVEHHLHQAVGEFSAEWGAAVVMDPLSGEVLASAVVPDFAPAQPIPRGAEGDALEQAKEHLRNRVISDAYEPGSIFKPFIAGPAYDAELIALEQTFAIDGPVHYWGSRPIHDTHTYDSLRVYEIVGFSSNIGMGLVGDILGNQRLNEYVRRLGFGDLTGVELPGEQAGLLFPLSRWTRFSTQSIPIGQEIAATPLQILTAFLPFCNDGILYRPRIVRGVIGPDGVATEDNSRPIPIRRVMSARAAREFREVALRHVVTHGTADHLNLPEYAMFGKTGTAQIARKDGRGYEPGAYVGSFVCGAPVENPRVAVLVSLYHPKGGKYYGGTVSGPAAARIVAETLTYMRVAHSPETPARVE